MNLFKDGIQVIQALHGAQIQTQRVHDVQVDQSKAVVLGPLMHGGHHPVFAVHFQGFHNVSRSNGLHAGQQGIHHFVGDFRNAAVLGELHHGVALRVEQVKGFTGGPA